MATALVQSNDELLASIKMFERKVKALSKLGPGAAMAAAVNNSRLRSLKAEATVRGIELSSSPAGRNKSVAK